MSDHFNCRFRVNFSEKLREQADAEELETRALRAGVSLLVEEGLLGEANSLPIDHLHQAFIARRDAQE
mgnify:CR=1 FL=1